MNTQSPDWNQNDPLGLGDLPLHEPDVDGWDEIRLALESNQTKRSNVRKMAGWLAAAATVVLVVGLGLREPGPAQPGAGTTDSAEMLAQQSQPVDLQAGSDPATLDSLITMSQLLEQRLRNLRSETGGLPANSAAYMAELEDLVAQVDGQLNFDPASVDLWGQRVNLLLDLELIYQHQWEREYGRMASL